MSLREGVREVALGLQEMATSLDDAEKRLTERVDGSAKGVHNGIAEMHQSIMGELHRIADRLLRLEESSKNERTAASAIPHIIGRIGRLEEAVGLPSEGSNGHG